VRVLLTGIAGFAGSHLAEFLVRHSCSSEAGKPSDPGQANLGNQDHQASRDNRDIEIHGVIHRHDRRIQHLRKHLHLHRGDLRNALWVSELVQNIQPDLVIHLAAWSDVGGSWRQPWTTYELNISCQLNLLEALRRWTPECRTLVVTSNEVYGLLQEEDLPVDEETPFRPNNPYGVSKVTQDVMALQYWNSHALPTICARSFNHIGPGQSDDFAASAFARQIAEIEAGQREPVVSVGNLDAERDFTDVRDIVTAYWLLINRGTPGQAYNVGSGQSVPVRLLLETLLDLTPVRVELAIDPARLRPSDIPISVCDNRRLVAATGWQPKFNLRDTLRDILDKWRELVRYPTGPEIEQDYSPNPAA
jgi:GDP-4-dehydro-6-deoxy-D-mannose reductase